MANDDRTAIAPRFDDSFVEQLDEYADQADATRTGVTRRLVQFGAEALIDDVLQDLELDQQEREHIEATREIRDLLPGSWRDHVRGLFAENIKHGATIEDLNILARRYREQAEIKAEKAALHDEIPSDVDYTGIVDDELAADIEAADASTWDDGVENPYEHQLAGVDDGLQDRRVLVTLIETAMSANDGQVGLDPQVGIEDVGGPLVGSILPDDVAREDVAAFAERLLREGIPPDDVHSYLLDGTTNEDATTPGRNGTPPVLAGETQQAGIVESIAATDGGPLSRHSDTEADTDMNPHNENHHDSDEDECIEISRQPPAREVPADE
jgi:hypothetical protein